jgi:hypothetical protein
VAITLRTRGWANLWALHVTVLSTGRAFPLWACLERLRHFHCPTHHNGLNVLRDRCIICHDTLRAIGYRHMHATMSAVQPDQAGSMG